MKFRVESWSVFDTHFWFMSTFLVAFLSFALVEYFLLATQHHSDLNENTTILNDNVALIMRKTSLIFGALASILLLIIIHPILGWISMFFCTLFFLKAAYELVKYGSNFEIKDTFFKVIYKLKATKSMICGQSELDESPV